MHTSALILFSRTASVVRLWPLRRPYETLCLIKIPICVWTSLIYTHTECWRYILGQNVFEGKHSRSTPTEIEWMTHVHLIYCLPTVILLENESYPFDGLQAQVINFSFDCLMFGLRAFFIFKLQFIGNSVPICTFSRRRMITSEIFFFHSRDTYYKVNTKKWPRYRKEKINQICITFWKIKGHVTKFHFLQHRYIPLSHRHLSHRNKSRAC